MEGVDPEEVLLTVDVADCRETCVSSVPTAAAMDMTSLDVGTR